MVRIHVRQLFSVLVDVRLVRKLLAFLQRNL